MSETPSKKYYHKDRNVRVSEYLEFENLDTKDEEKHNCCAIESKIEKVVYGPIVAHFETIDLHILNESSLLLKYHLIDKHRKSHTHTDWKNHQTDKGETPLNLGIEIRSEREELNSSNNSCIVKQCTHIRLIKDVSNGECTLNGPQIVVSGVALGIVNSDLSNSVVTVILPVLKVIQLHVI